jgi:hypothetical protein
MTTDQLGADVRARQSPVLPEGYRFGLGFAVRTQTGIAAFAGSEGDYYWAALTALTSGSIRRSS